MRKIKKINDQVGDINMKISSGGSIIGVRATPPIISILSFHSIQEVIGCPYRSPCVSTYIYKINTIILTMNESIVLTSSKDLNGICILDLHTATPICSNLKNNIADSGSMCTVGGSSSYSGNSSSTSDYLCIAQAKKPSISIWSWGKAQPIMQCHVQEVMSCLESDRYGAYIIGGSKKGMIYIWEVATGALLTSWQAHFKEVTRVRCSPNSDFFGSASTDGMARVWSLSAIIDTAALNQFRQSHTPYKSWSPHTLAVKDMCFSGGYSTMRVFTCSLDRSLVLYDVHRGVQVMRIGLSQGLECLICNPTEDFCFVGSSSGHIFAVDLSIAASNVCQVRMHQNQTERTRNTKTGIVATMNEKPGSTAASATDTSNNKLLATATSTTNPSTSTSTSSTTNTAVAMTLEGHTRTVTALCVSADNCTLVSVSEDGSLRLWDIWTGQCLKEVKPLHKAAITNAKVSK